MNDAVLSYSLQLLEQILSGRAAVPLDAPDPPRDRPPAAARGQDKNKTADSYAAADRAKFLA